MPISSYFKGHGTEVMNNMQKSYGSKKGKSVFYATANKKPAMKPKATEDPIKLLGTPGRLKNGGY